MSIYATHWILKFPRYGDAHSGCEWVDVMGQGVPAHIGTPTFGHGYESGDPYAGFLPPAVPMPPDEDEAPLRAMVVVRAQSEKNGQEYVDPLIVLSGEEYASASFQTLHDQICDALRGNRPRVIAELIDQRGSTPIFQNDTVEDHEPEKE